MPVPATHKRVLEKRLAGYKSGESQPISHAGRWKKGAMRFLLVVTVSPFGKLTKIALTPSARLPFSSTPSDRLNSSSRCDSIQFRRVVRDQVIDHAVVWNRLMDEDEAVGLVSETAVSLITHDGRVLFADVGKAWHPEAVRKMSEAGDLDAAAVGVASQEKALHGVGVHEEGGVSERGSSSECSSSSASVNAVC